MLYNIIHSKHYTILEIGFGVFILSLYKCSKYVFGNDKSVKSKGKMKTRFYPFISDKGMCFNQRWTFTLMLKII